MGCPRARLAARRLLSAVLLSLAATSCGAGEGVTMSASGCVYDGPRQFARGPISITLSNELQDGHVKFALVRLRKGHAFKELSSYVASDEGWGKMPRFVDQVATTRVEAGGRDALETSVYGGIYGIVCAQVMNVVEIARFATGPIIVEPA